MATNISRTALFLATNILIIFLSHIIIPKDHIAPLLTAEFWKKHPPQDIEQPANSGNPMITQWLQNRLTSLYESAPPPEEADFKALFLSTFSEDAQVVYNHESVSVDTFQEKLTAANFALVRASVGWQDLVEIPDKEDPQAGIVAGVFVVTRSMKFRIRVGPAQRINHNVFSAKIGIDPNAQPDSEGSKQRISQFFISSSDKAAPIHLQGVPPHPAPVQDIDPALLEKK